MMNNIPNWKLKIIDWLVGDEPIFLNWVVFCDSLKEGVSFSYIPANGQKMTESELDGKTVIFPDKCFIKGNER